MPFHLTDDPLKMTAILYQITHAAGVTTSHLAGESLSGHRMVTLNAQSEVVLVGKEDLGTTVVVGMTLHAAAAGEAIKIASVGPVTDANWMWDTSKRSLFLRDNGQISQTPPTSGFLCVIGYCVSQTQIFITVQAPIRLYQPETLS
ncbi:MAG: hypothetical protein HQL80_03520 [Magnetococcales bacterium]|nr:hypothetical protein [Magnetococcales bacterium]